MRIYDIEFDIDAHLEEMAATKRMRIARGLCLSCGGHGADPLSDNVNWLPCRECGGSGKAKQSLVEGGSND